MRRWGLPTAGRASLGVTYEDEAVQQEAEEGSTASGAPKAGTAALEPSRPYWE